MWQIITLNLLKSTWWKVRLVAAYPAAGGVFVCVCVFFCEDWRDAIVPLNVIDSADSGVSLPE